MSYRHPALRESSLDLWSSLLSFDRVDASITLFSLNHSLVLRCIQRLCDTWGQRYKKLWKEILFEQKICKKGRNNLALAELLLCWPLSRCGHSNIKQLPYTAYTDHWVSGTYTPDTLHWRLHLRLHWKIFNKHLGEWPTYSREEAPHDREWPTNFREWPPHKNPNAWDKILVTVGVLKHHSTPRRSV